MKCEDYYEVNESVKPYTNLWTYYINNLAGMYSIMDRFVIPFIRGNQVTTKSHLSPVSSPILPYCVYNRVHLTQNTISWTEIKITYSASLR